MTTYIALLRAINVGGHNVIAMADLRALFEALGYSNVQTLLQSGNIVFRAKSLAGAGLERRLEGEIAKTFKLSVDSCIRTASEWHDLVVKNPFPREVKRDPARLVAMCLKGAPAREQLTELRAAIHGPETVELIGRALYAVYPNGQGTSKLTNSLIEDKLQTRGTARNWNTVLKLAALANA